MNKRKCLKNHSEYLEPICMAGFTNRTFGYIRRDFYCPICKRSRTEKLFEVVPISKLILILKYRNDNDYCSYGERKKDK